MSSQAELIVKRQREISFRSKNSASWNQAFTRYRMNQVSFIYIDIVSYLGADHLIFFGGGEVEDSDCARIFFRPGEQDSYFFPVKVQRKIFSPNIFRGRIFFFRFHIAIVRDVAGVFSQRRPRTEFQEGPRNCHCALFYIDMS
jgi:hypothetical protein